MAVNQEQYKNISKELIDRKVTLVAVSKTKPPEDILELYELGHRDFGENYVQELVDKYEQLPKDIRWHFIGHLQSNKVKYLAPFVYLVHGVDSFSLLKEINKKGSKAGRVIPVLLQVHIAMEETKFGLDANELGEVLHSSELTDLKHIKINGLMGMASFTEDLTLIRKEFLYLKTLYDQYASLRLENVSFTTLSMGMSSDYKIAVEEGSTMVRIGSLLFGARDYVK